MTKDNDRGRPLEGNNILEVVQSGLCTGCGTCVALCSRGAVTLRMDDARGFYVPQVDCDRCSDCGICREACPGESVDFPRLNREIFGRVPDDIILGNYSRCYTGHAADNGIRFNGSSGGLVTALLLHALEGGLITGALVTRMNHDRPLVPEPFVARTGDDIIAAARSKYCPVPANVALQAVLSEEGKYAVVGLPCHMHALRKAEAVNHKLRERVGLRIGIFCGHAPTFLWTELHIGRRGVRKDQVAGLDYRGEGWPGKMSVTLKDGDKRQIPYHDAWGPFANFGYYRRCTMCWDQSAQLADLSCGDAWLPEFCEDRAGTSIVVCRTTAAEGIVQAAAASGRIELREATADKARQSQGSFRGKQRIVVTSLALSRLGRRRTPRYGVDLMRPDVAAWLAGFRFQIESWASSKRCLWGLLRTYAGLRTRGRKRT